MGTPLRFRSNGSYTRRSGALRSENCREVVQVLRAHNDAITVTELAKRVATTESASTADASAVDSVRIRLHHVDLPKLADAGLLDWDKEAGEVFPTDHPVYDGSSADEDGSVASSRASTATLADDRRREILASIESDGGPITRETLARNVAARDADGEPSQSRIENVLIQLHHRHLPKLADAGLLEYDRSDGRITYQGPSELPPASRAASDV